MSEAKAKKLVLNDNLISAAQELIRELGLEKVTARAIAAKAGCGLGTIYNVYPDLRSLFMEVNARTYAKIEEAFATSVNFDDDKGPVENMISLAMVYATFAKQNTNLWRAIFDLNLQDLEEVPGWYSSLIDKMFGYIEVQVGVLMPDLDQDERFLMTRALYSSVHGIMDMGIRHRTSGVPFEQIEEMIHAVLMRLGSCEHRS